MTDNELLIECAKLDGFEHQERRHPQFNTRIIHFIRFVGQSIEQKLVMGELPPYLTSYDAIIPLIRKVLTTEEEQTRFNYALTETLKSDGINTRAFGWTWLCNAGANPRQLAIALLKSKGIIKV